MNTLESTETQSLAVTEVDAELDHIAKEIERLQQRATELRRLKPGEPVGEYSFTGWDGEAVTLSELFGDKRELIAVHNMGRKCRYCTLWADGLIGFTKHLEDRAALVVTTPDDPETQRKFARDRGWNFRMVSTQGTTFKKDMGFEPNPGEYWPGVTVFRKNDDGSIEAMSSAQFGPGDLFCSLWHFFDLLPSATEWEPQYHYA
jgi:predicted dithiol-disulfide oxidoreductase (DUF899 family)